MPLLSRRRIANGANSAASAIPRRASTGEIHGSSKDKEKYFRAPSFSFPHERACPTIHGNKTLMDVGDATNEGGVKTPA